MGGWGLECKGQSTVEYGKEIWDLLLNPDYLLSSLLPQGFSKSVPQNSVGSNITVKLKKKKSGRIYLCVY